MKKIILSIILLGGANANAQQLLEVLRPHITNVFTPSEKCLERVKDRNYGDGDHDFIYCAVKDANGKIWLNMNLGAAYAKEGSVIFNPEYAGDNPKDTNAWGSMFRFGRPADGHELIETYGTDNQYYYTYTRKYPKLVWDNDWLGDDNDNENVEQWENEWGNGKDESNPCPIGYKVASIGDLISVTDTGTAIEDGLQEPQVVKHGNLNLMFGAVDIYKNDTQSWTETLRLTDTRYGETPSTYLPEPGGTAGLWGANSFCGSGLWFKCAYYLDWGNTMNGRVIPFYVGGFEYAYWFYGSMPIRCIKRD